MNEILQNWDWTVLTDALLRVVPALICVTLHELCHGLAAFALGDPTAKHQGRLTLNPLKHMDVMGLVMMAVFRFGWAKPVPVNMGYFKNPKWGMAFTALAGPASNVLITCVCYFLYGLLYLPLGETAAGYWVLELLYLTGSLSISLAVFNLLPIPPLDGSKLLFALLPETAYRKLMRYERYGMVLLAVIAFTGVLAAPLYRAVDFASEQLTFFARLGLSLIPFGG